MYCADGHTWQILNSVNPATALLSLLDFQGFLSAHQVLPQTQALVQLQPQLMLAAQVREQHHENKHSSLHAGTYQALKKIGRAP